MEQPAPSSSTTPAIAPSRRLLITLSGEDAIRVSGGDIRSCLVEFSKHLLLLKVLDLGTQLEASNLKQADLPPGWDVRL